MCNTDYVRHRLRVYDADYVRQVNYVRQIMCDTDYDLILDGFSQNSYLAHPQRLLLCNTPSHVHRASHDAASTP
jgi:hypothetical protein